VVTIGCACLPGDLQSNHWIILTAEREDCISKNAQAHLCVWWYSSGAVHHHPAEQQGPLALQAGRRKASCLGSVQCGIPAAGCLSCLPCSLLLHITCSGQLLISIKNLLVHPTAARKIRSLDFACCCPSFGHLWLCMSRMPQGKPPSLCNLTMTRCSACTSP